MESMNQNENQYTQTPDGCSTQQPYHQPVIIAGNPAEDKRRTKNLAIISLVCGILSIVFCIFFYVSIILGIAGLIQALISTEMAEAMQSQVLSPVRSEQCYPSYRFWCGFSLLQTSKQDGI